MYTSLPTKEEHDSSSSASTTSGDDIEGLLSSKPQARFMETKSHNNRLLYILLPLTSVVSIIFGLFLNPLFYPTTTTRDAEKSCMPQVQHYSPVLSEVDTSMHIEHFNGSFMKVNAFRGEAGPETDAAWESLGVNYRGIAVPHDEAIKSGFRPDQVKINPKYGGGFPANVEGLHHLHCLNLVRQALYYNVDYYRAEGKGAFVNKEHIVKLHVSHCLDIIRQQLMCMPDTGLLGQVWWDPSWPKAFVDFNTEHKCKNFDAIREWAKERQLPESVAEDFLLPPEEGDRIFTEIP